ncbi:uncharacterized protein LOC125535051 [Triticum urartu]|uniref:uncharacterized protein LOC125535049 n=1 Tax=Triticum urartu TaxID=4572 RepID=UPI002044ABA5|nr:uncharacterized protein LOC125535049 [Triticum urartu]XP_048554068.1 uncharacterized protein LOC125535051 [Triticum urartu]
MIPISIEQWLKPKDKDSQVSNVSDRQKADLWTALQENFTFPPEEDPENPVRKPMIKAYALKKMAELFRRWKNELKSSFVNQDKTPEFIGRFEKIKDQWPEFVTKTKSERAAKMVWKQFTAKAPGLPKELRYTYLKLRGARVSRTDRWPPPPPPPPARIVVVVLALVHLALAPMLALGRVLCVAAGALPYLGFVLAWVISAATAGQIVASRSWGESSDPFLFLQALTYGALKVLIYSILAFVALLVLLVCVAYMIAAVSVSTSGFKKSALEAFTQESVAESFRLPRTAVLGLVADVAFFLLVVAGLLVVMMSPDMEGSMSQGEMVASVIMDVALFGMHAIACFVIIPALILSVWKGARRTGKRHRSFVELTVVDIC